MRALLTPSVGVRWCVLGLALHVQDVREWSMVNFLLRPKWCQSLVIAPATLGYLPK